METNDQAFKYALQDFSNVYIGAKTTYGELADAEDIPSKLKTAIYRLIYDNKVSRDESIETHLWRMEDTELAYLFYSQLKIKIKAVLTCEKKSRHHKEEIYSIEQFTKEVQVSHKKEDMVIQEISFSKLKMGTLSI